MTVIGKSESCWYPSPTRYVASWLWSSLTRTSEIFDRNAGGIRSRTLASVDAALYATTRMPIFFAGTSADIRNAPSLAPASARGRRSKPRARAGSSDDSIGTPLGSRSGRLTRGLNHDEGPHTLGRFRHSPAAHHAHQREAARAGREQADPLLRDRGHGRRGDHGDRHRRRGHSRRN